MVPLGEVCELSGGGTPPKNNAAFYGGSIPWATVRDLNVDVLKQTEHTITEAGLKASSSRVIPAGEIVIASRVGLGKVVTLGQDTAINQDLRAVIPRNPDRLDRKFLYLWFKSVADRIIEAGTGATVQGVKLPFLNSLPIPLPPLEEQKRIVAVLDEAFEGLSRARANAEANLADADELFGAVLDRIYRIEAANWPTATLPSVCTEFGRGKSRHRPRNDPRLYEGPYPFIQTGDISRAGHLLTDFEQTYSDFGLQQSKLWKAGTVCVAIVGATIGESAVTAFDCCFPDSVIGMSPDPQKADPEFVEYALCCFKAELKEAGKGSARDNINLATFEARQFPMPDITTQRSAVERLKETSQLKDAFTDECRRRLTALEDLRQSLLQKAFAGELT